jgi:nucleotide-binding universal stress UspA family protein
MGPLLCCLDDSPEARAALRVARALAERLGLPLVLLHVEPGTEAPGVSAAPGGQARLREMELSDARALLRRLADDEGLGDHVQMRTETGSAADRIVVACEETGASFVVLGSRGRGNVASAVLGSVSHAVASRAPCPVVIVPHPAAERGSP